MTYQFANFTAANLAAIPAWPWRSMPDFEDFAPVRGPGSAIVDRAEFAAAILKCADVAEKSTRCSIPILADVLIAAVDGALVVRSTDLDMETAVEIHGAAVDDTLAVCVPVHTVAKLVKSAKASQDVQIDFDGGDNVAFKFGDLRTSLQCRPYADFPDMAARDSFARFDLFADDFKRALDNVAFAVSTEETRYYLNGVYMAANERDGLTFVATDGHRLARYVLPQPAAEIDGVILPASLIKLLARRLKAKDCPDWLSVELAHSQVKIRHGNETITSKLIDGTFPDYERVIPTGNDKVLRVDGAELIAAVKQVQVISSDRGRAVKLELSRNRIRLTVNNPDSGSATIDVLAHFDSDGGILEIGCNAQYLIDVVSKVSEPVLRFQDNGSPIRLEDNDDSAHTIVLMPMRV